MIGIALIAEGLTFLFCHLHVLIHDFPFSKALALHTYRFYIHGFHKPWIKNVQGDLS